MSTDPDAQVDRRDHSTPDTLRLRSISPSLTVGDLDASLAWYRDVLGFHVEQTFEHEGKVAGAKLVAGTASLFVGQDDWAKGRDRVKGEGFRLNLATADDVDAIAAGIEARGGTLEAPPADMP